MPTMRRSVGLSREALKGPTYTGPPALLSAVSYVNAREEHDSAQHFGESEALTEDDDARDHTGKRDQVLVDQDPVGTEVAYAPVPDSVSQRGGNERHVGNSNPRHCTYRFPLPAC